MDLIVQDAEEKMDKLIITAAMIGAVTTREKSPYPPMTPQEIAASAVESCQAGASVCHIHIRDPITHKSSMKFELYKEAFERIREKCDIIINLTTGSGARLFYSPRPPENPWDASGLAGPEERVEHVMKLK